MKRFKQLIFTIVVSILVAGLPIWFKSNDNNANDFLIPLMASLILGITFIVLTKHKISTICYATTFGVIAAIIINITIDTKRDTTSHNLLPFEVLIDTIFVFFASFAGASLGNFIRLLVKRKH